jgi:alkylation response protein AidB-like acyl-CoA dehydrogenase
LNVLDGGKIVLAAYAVGAAQAAVDMALAYSKMRVQFGRPIGSFQALQHKLADAAMGVEQARTLVQYAAWLRGAQRPCSQEAAMAKLLAGSAFRRAAYAATLTHGGYGFMEEQDIQLYFRRAKLLEHQLGSPVAQQESIIPAAETRGDR